MNTRSVLVALSLSSFALPCMADTFKMKDGTTVEGKVLSETPEAYLVEVQVTKSIKDERTLKKADVLNRETEKLDLKAFEAIEKLVPTADLLSPEEYAASINAVGKFLKDHASSPKAAQAKTMLATLKSEATQIGSGGLKVNGAMISPAQYEANAYELDARVQEVKIRALVNQGRILESLRSYADFEKNYSTTLAAGSLRPVMIQIMRNYVEESREALTSYDDRLKKRSAGLDQMTGENRRATQDAIAEEDAAVEAKLKAEKDAKVTWVTTSPFNKASLDETVKYGDTELKRLAAIKVALGLDGGKAYRDAWALIHGSGTPTSISSALTAAKTAGVPASYLAPLEEKAKNKAK